MQPETMLIVMAIAFILSAIGGIIQGILIYKSRDAKMRSDVEVCRLRLDETTVKLGVVLSALELIQATLPKPLKARPDAILPESAFRTKPME
jgi:hypothetical protein